MNTNNTNTNSQATLIDEALTGLTEKQRQYVRLICISKSTLEQAAKMVGFSDNPARVYRRLTRIAAVREAMEKVNGIIAQSQNKQHGSSSEQKEQKQEAIREEAKTISEDSKSEQAPAPAAKGTDALRDVLREIMGDTFDEKRLEPIIRAIVKREVGLAPVRVEVVTPSTKTVDMGIQHRNFKSLVTKLLAGCNVYLAGPAGTGKTTAGEFSAQALAAHWEREVPFYFNGAIDSEHKLLGFTDAQGRIVSRPFRKAFTEGGVYMFDEVDASLPSALLAFNAALSNGWCDFPDGCFKKHPDFRCIAAANTWGFGATHDYVGRAKLDEAFRNRFVMLAWDTDETLERHLALTKIEDQNLGSKWITYVQQCRAKAKIAGVRCVISPRASIYGCMVLQAGETWQEAEESCIRMGMAEESWAQIKG
jgi:cobaltochelatase CobS